MGKLRQHAAGSGSMRVKNVRRDPGRLEPTAIKLLRAYLGAAGTRNDCPRIPCSAFSALSLPHRYRS